MGAKHYPSPRMNPAARLPIVSAAASRLTPVIPSLRRSHRVRSSGEADSAIRESTSAGVGLAYGKQDGADVGLPVEAATPGGERLTL